MKAMLIGSLSAVIGLAAAHVFAQDGPPPPFQRVAATGSAAVTLSRPIPIASAESSAVTPATSLDRSTPLFRAKTIDPDVPQLMPVGPTADTSMQPGTVKSMGTAEGLHAPRVVENASSGATPFVLMGRRRFDATRTTPEPAPQNGQDPSMHGGTTIEDCVSCDTCVTDACGAFGIRRWRDWCGCCDDPCCLPRPRGWVRGEYLLWGLSDPNHLPPLLTTGSTGDARPGALGQANTMILFGGDDALFPAADEIRSGGRISAGIWFPRRCNWGIDASFFMIARRTLHGEAGSDADGNPLLARPFFQPSFPNAPVVGETAEFVSFPGVLAGKFSYDSTTRFWGGDANLRHRFCCGPRYWLDCFVGYRYLQLADTIDINEDITNLQFAPGSGDTRRFLLHDNFSTRNMFNGLQVGLEGEMKLFRRWFVAGNVKIAAGNMQQIVNIDGSTTFVDSSVGTVTGRGGLFALASNIGRQSKNEFAVAPEIGIKIGFDINDHWRVYAGYNVLYISSVVRAGDQIDRVVNFAGMAPEPTNLNPAVVSPARPAVLFRQSDFWAQGGQFGVEYHW